MYVCVLYVCECVSACIRCWYSLVFGSRALADSRDMLWELLHKIGSAPV